MQVNTWRGNDERQWTIDWEALRNASLDNAWNICKPQLVTPKDRKSPSGTEIIFAMPVNKLRRIWDLYEDMAFRYTPALEQGCTIPFQCTGPGHPRELKAYEAASNGPRSA